MFQNTQIPFLWDHTLAGDIISVAFDHNRHFILSVSTQVLKLASRFANQNSKEEISCLLIGNCDNKEGNKVVIDIDRIECNLTSYLSDNQLLCTNDICIPLIIYKNRSDAPYKNEDYLCSLAEYFKGFEDIALPILLSKVMFLKAYAGFSVDKSKSKHPLAPISWIDFKLIIPDFHLTLSPITKIPIFRSALISSFENQAYSSTVDNTFTFGYLSIDQPGKVHFLLHSDERTLTAALVGIWVHGVFDVSDVLVIATCMKYILLKSHDNKTAKPPFPFLLAQFTNHTKDPIQFYDVKWPKGPSEEHDSLLSNISFNVLSATDNLDRYYQPPNEKANSFTITLSKVGINNRAYETINKALKTFVTKNYASNRKDDTVPRCYGNNRGTVQNMAANGYQGLEVSDVSLLINDVSTMSSASGDSQRNYGSNNSNLKSSVCPTEIRHPPKPESGTTYLSNNKNDEAVPRPLLRKQHIAPTVSSQVSRNDLPQPHFNQVQFIPQQMFPYPTLYPTNPYIMLPTNMYLHGQEQNIPVVSKPPPRPKAAETSSKKVKDLSTKTDRNKAPIKSSTEKSSKIVVSNSHTQVDRAAITDVTNTTPKRVLQLDREEDLATLEFLVQQIINQRHKDKPVMVSTGVNTTLVDWNRPTTRTIEISTDLPSFTNNTLCARCQQFLVNNDPGAMRDTTPCTEILSVTEKEDNENSFDSTLLDTCTNRNDAAEDLEQHDDQNWLDPSEENMHYSELLINLEDFVKQSRNSTTEKMVINEPSNNNESTKLNILEEAVQNLRELDINRDCASQYWESLRNTVDTDRDNFLNDSHNCNERESLDVTILQQRINYVSLFLNNSIVAPEFLESRNSQNEQSIFIDSLARKYLHKATTELSKMGGTNVNSSSISSGSIGASIYIAGRASYSKDVSVSTRDYLHKYNLVEDHRPNDSYYSSIRMPDGHPLPRQKFAISSTPAPHCTQPLVGCKKLKLANQIAEYDNWSGIRILEGLEQQPSILAPGTRDTSHCWSQSRQIDAGNSAFSSDMVLDLDRLRLLPKYL